MTKAEWKEAVRHIRNVWGTSKAFSKPGAMEVAFESLRVYTKAQVFGAVTRLVKTSPEYPPTLPKLLVAISAIRPEDLLSADERIEAQKRKALPEPDYSKALEDFRRSNGGLLPSEIFRKRTREEAQ